MDSWMDELIDRWVKWVIDDRWITDVRMYVFMHVCQCINICMYV